MRFAVVAILLFFSIPETSHAFKWSKCKAVYKPWKMSESKSKVVGEVIANYLAQLTSQVTTQSSGSTTSYVSSTGDCRAFAKAEEERYLYIAGTMTELKLESAEGQGEHVASLATLYGCSNQVRPQFAEMLKSNHSDIFSQDATDTSIITPRITDRVMQSEALSKNCNLETI